MITQKQRKEIMQEFLDEQRRKIIIGTALMFRIFELLRGGRSQNSIALELNMAQSDISRIMSRFKKLNPLQSFEIQRCIDSRRQKYNYYDWNDIRRGGRE